MNAHKLKRKNFVHGNFKLFASLLVLALLLPAVILAGNQTVHLFSQAAVVPANLLADAGQSRSTLDRPWANLSQGGETENGAMIPLTPVENQIHSLGVRYVRIDHVFDYPYQDRVRQIVASGATPFISLSYFPRDVASSDVGTPEN